MFKFIFTFSTLLFLTGCFGGNKANSTNDDITYTYQISSLPEVHGFSTTITSNFTLQWNEDDDGNVSGIYINQDTQETLTVTGVSNLTGRTITAERSEPINNILYFSFIIPPGSLNGEISIDVESYNSTEDSTSTDTIQVNAQTATYDDDDNDDGDDGNESEIFTRNH